MIVADSKPISELFGFIEDYKKVLILGCGECVTVCQVGGEKEVGIMAQALRLKAKNDGKKITFIENTIRRQCEPEFVDPVIQNIGDVDAVVSLACGVGVNFFADRGSHIPVYPGVDTTFMGATIEHGEWAERCSGCGKCILHLTGGICPIARCSKNILNGPCGGTDKGKCEISTQDNPIDCAWALIIERAKTLGTLDTLKEVIAPKDWSCGRDGGPRKRVREDLRIAKEQEG